MSEQLKPFEEIDTLHELLGVALDDMAQIMDDERYYVDMSNWHLMSDGVCCVCLAGSVMAKTMNAPLEACVRPEALSDACTRRLYALDALRRGQIPRASEYLHGHADGLPQELVCKWDVLPANTAWAFGPRMAKNLYGVLREMQSDLEKAGI